MSSLWGFTPTYCSQWNERKNLLKIYWGSEGVSGQEVGLWDVESSKTAQENVLEYLGHKDLKECGKV